MRFYLFLLRRLFDYWLEHQNVRVELRELGVQHTDEVPVRLVHDLDVVQLVVQDNVRLEACDNGSMASVVDHTDTDTLSTDDMVEADVHIAMVHSTVIVEMMQDNQDSQHVCQVVVVVVVEFLWNEMEACFSVFLNKCFKFCQLFV